MDITKICKRLADNDQTLTTLYISNNNIEDEGAKALATSLQYNSTLTYLYLKNNDIGDEGAKALATSLQYNSTLTELYISRNGINNNLKQEIKILLDRNKQIQELKRKSLKFMCARIIKENNKLMEEAITYLPPIIYNQI